MQSSENHLQKKALAALSSTIGQDAPVGEDTATAALIIEERQRIPQVEPESRPEQKQRHWQGWFEAFQRIFPIYMATHIVFFLLTYLANLFLFDNFSPQKYSIHDLILQWNHWDTSQFTDIAQYGYNAPWRSAFFPLYPMLEALLTPILHKPFYAGLVISNLAILGLFLVLYRLVRQDADEAQATRTVLYLAVFPTAFFLAAAYNESLFLFLAVFSFYHMRRGNWWLASLCGFLASLTRSAGVLLFVPFCYEYLRQHEFHFRKIRFDVVGGALIPAGLVLFALYCYYKFHDFLSFSHVQIYWGRHLALPWDGFVNAINILEKKPPITFDSIHNVIDLSMGLVMLVLLVLCFVGPWRFSRDRIVYGLYSIVVYLFLILFPGTGTFPLESLSRLVIELFPIFIVLGAMGKKSAFNIYYLTISTSLLAFMLLQFLIGRWIV